MWDLTPDTDLLAELPEEYAFETALADLIVSCHLNIAEDLVVCIINCSFRCLLVFMWVFIICLIIYQDNSLQAVWSNGMSERRLIRYGISVIMILLC